MPEPERDVKKKEGYYQRGQNLDRPFGAVAVQGALIGIFCGETLPIEAGKERENWRSKQHDLGFEFHIDEAAEAEMGRWFELLQRFSLAEQKTVLAGVLAAVIFTELELDKEQKEKLIQEGRLEEVLEEDVLRRLIQIERILYEAATHLNVSPLEGLSAPAIKELIEKLAFFEEAGGRIEQFPLLKQFIEKGVA